MNPHLPIEDPSERDSLVEQTTGYVRQSKLLRVLLVLTLADYAMAVLAVFLGRLGLEMAGFLVLLSMLAWFFAVGMPVMNREIDLRAGIRNRYWREVAEMFCRVVLCAFTAIFTALLVRLIGT